jgi:hypothetical protein
MITLPLVVGDINHLRDLHEKYYSAEFPFPDFAQHFIASFKVLNDDGQIITAGGVRLFPELILITDIEKPGIERAFAVKSALQIATLAASNYGNLFCSAPKDSRWHHIVASQGFNDSKDHNLVLAL